MVQSRTNSVSSGVDRHASATSSYVSPLPERREEEAAVCVVGSGPAAYTAGYYAARAMLKVIIFEGYLANGLAAGGQINLTDHVENFPGFPEPVTGPELAEKLRCAIS